MVINTCVKILSNFSKIDKILCITSGKSEKNNPNWSNIHKHLNLESSLWKTKIKKIFFPHSTLDWFFNNITHNSV